MKRSSLRPDPDLVRQFQQRARKGLSRRQGKSLARGDGLQRTAPKQRRRTPDEVVAAVARRSRNRCVGCGRRVTNPRRDRHHVLPVQKWPQHELEPDNQVLACLDCHMGHENWTPRLAWERLPACVFALARATGEPAVMYLEVNYPKGGSTRVH